MGEPQAVAVNSNKDNQPKDIPGGSVSLARHEAQCCICRSKYREQIEDLFVDWVSPDRIIEKYTNLSRDSIYRHAHARELFEKRKRNVNRVLEKIIERADWTSMTGAQVVSAIQAYVKLNNLAAPKPMPSPNAMELPKQGPPAGSENSGGGRSLPESNPQAELATPDDSQTGENGSPATETNQVQDAVADEGSGGDVTPRSEEHTSELQSQF